MRDKRADEDDGSETNGRPDRGRQIDTREKQVQSRLFQVQLVIIYQNKKESYCNDLLRLNLLITRGEGGSIFTTNAKHLADFLRSFVFILR